MHLFVLFLGCALFPTASTLRCYECTDISGSCTDTADCPSVMSQCGVMEITSYTGDVKILELTTRSCAVPAQCMNGSLNLGISRTIINSKCCATDLCNMDTPEPGSHSRNGKKCKTCTILNCDSTLNCVGDEDYCVSTTMDMEALNMTMKGCASKILCSGTLTGMIPGMNLKCCQGNLCNNAQSFGSSFLLLPVASVLSVTLFN